MHLRLKMHFKVYFYDRLGNAEAAFSTKDFQNFLESREKILCVRINFTVSLAILKYIVAIVKSQGGNSQNLLGKLVRFFL